MTNEETRRQRGCLFCGRTDRSLTREHIYPRWLDRVLKGMGLGATAVWVGDRKIRESAGLDEQLRMVCGDCNHGWMHDLERAFRSVAIPLITGTARRDGEAAALDLGAQRVVATWATKTWLLLEIGNRHLMRVTTTWPGALRTMYVDGRPPGGLQVFIGALSDEAAYGVATRFGSIEVRRESPRQSGVLVLMTIGYLALVMFVHERPGAGEIGFFGASAGMLRQVWPHQVSEVGWPTSPVVTTSAIAQLVPIGSIHVVPGQPRPAATDQS